MALGAMVLVEVDVDAGEVGMRGGKEVDYTLRSCLLAHSRRAAVEHKVAPGWDRFY